MKMMFSTNNFIVTPKPIITPPLTIEKSESKFTNTSKILYEPSNFIINRGPRILSIIPAATNCTSCGK